MKNKYIKRCLAKNVDFLYIKGLDSKLGKKFLKLSRDEQISFLCDEIKKETEKPLEKIELEKIDYYTDILGIISESPEGFLNDKELNTFFNKITKQHKKEIVKSDTKLKGSFVASKSWKRVAVIAATIALLLCTATVVGAINGVNVFKELYNFGLGIFDLEKGEEYDVGDITFIRNDNVKEYKTLNEFFAGENIIGVYYPENIPKGMKPINVSIKETMENTRIAFAFENNYISINVNSSDVYRMDKLEDVETYISKNGINVVYFCENGKYQFMFQIDEWYYSITTNSYEHAVSCVESMQEVK